MNTKQTREEMNELVLTVERNASIHKHTYNRKDWELVYEALDRLYTPDWIKIQEGCEMPKQGELVETFGPYGRDVFYFTDDGFNVELLLGGGLKETHWRYATPPPTE